MCKDIKYPEERKQEEFDRLLRQMIQDRKTVERLIDRLTVLEGFVEEVGKMAKTIE